MFACAEYEAPPKAGEPEAGEWAPELLNLLPCGHLLHKECLVDWLVISGRCPLCQRPVQDKQEGQV